VQFLMGLHLGRQYHIEMESIPDADKVMAFDAVAANLVTDRHDGSLSTEVLAQKIRHLALVEGCKFIFLDHVSIVVSGMQTSNERKDLDLLMTNLRGLAQSLKVNFQIIAHIKRQDGKPANEGGRVHLTDLRGSAALEQLSNAVVALERDQQGQEQVSTVRILKNRFAGWQTGPKVWLEYDPKTGRMLEVEEPHDDHSDFPDDQRATNVSDF